MKQLIVILSMLLSAAAFADEQIIIPSQEFLARHDLIFVPTANMAGVTAPNDVRIGHLYYGGIGPQDTGTTAYIRLVDKEKGKYVLEIDAIDYTDKLFMEHVTKESYVASAGITDKDMTLSVIYVSNPSMDLADPFDKKGTIRFEIRKDW